MSHDSMHVEAAQASASERGKEFYHFKEFLMFSTFVKDISKIKRLLLHFLCLCFKTLSKDFIGLFSTNV